jgi:single-stranded DNA-specific DHH superfamily exonuclease
MKDKKLKKMIKYIESYLEKLSPDDQVCLLHHDDADGCTSAALFSILIKRLTGGYHILFPIRVEGNVNRRQA